jgi:5-methylcytosine-specific restriction enzyme subunit McrC
MIHFQLIGRQKNGKSGNDYINIDDFIEVLEGRKMGIIFEEFVRNFYKLNIEDKKVKESIRKKDLEWEWGNKVNDEYKELIPKMETDVYIEGEDYIYIIDTKYYKDYLTKNYEKKKLIPGNLYQIFSYVKNIKKRNKKIEGILLYPLRGKSLNIEAKTEEYKLSIKTIDLTKNWKEIEKRLRNIVPKAFQTK